MQTAKTLEPGAIKENQTQATVPRTETTLTINAAFLAEIKAIHQELWHLLDSTRQMCRRAQSTARWQATFVESVCELRDLFAMQFSLEEGFGYFAEPAVVEADVSQRAMALRDDHQALYQEIARISEWLEDLRYRGQLTMEMDQVRATFESFYDQIQTHEKKEEELIFDTYCNDLGTGD